jgi:hypothetical protein
MGGSARYLAWFAGVGCRGIATALLPHEVIDRLEAGSIEPFDGH